MDRRFLLCLLVGAVLLEASHALNLESLPMALQGQGFPPPGAPTAVQMDVLIDNVRDINQHSNSYDAVHFIHLTWADPRAAQQIETDTLTWVQGLANNSANSPTDSGCARPCDSSRHPAGGCCSNVFLPHVEFHNMIAINQESPYRWRIWVDPANTTLMHWSMRLTSTWHSPWDFRAWPFEHQHLLLEASIAPVMADKVYLTLGNAQFLSNTPHTKGTVLPGWNVAKITKRMYNNGACANLTGFTSSVYSTNQNLTTVSVNPLSPQSWAQATAKQPEGVVITSIDSADDGCHFNASAHYEYPEALARYGPDTVVVDIMIKRSQKYYVLANVLPLLLLDYMVFITYAMERSDLESRMGVVVTLVLSVSALQFTYDFPPASYLNAVQQITLTSYCLFFLVAIESMIASTIHRLHKRKREHQALLTVAHGRPVLTNDKTLNLSGTMVPIREGSTSFDGGYNRPSPVTGVPPVSSPPASCDITVTYTPETGGGSRDFKMLQVQLPDERNPKPSPSFVVPKGSVDNYDPRPTVGGRRAGPVAEARESDGYAISPAPDANYLRQRQQGKAGQNAGGCCGGCFDGDDSEGEGAKETQMRNAGVTPGGPQQRYVAPPSPIKRKGTALSRAFSRTVSRVTRKIPNKIDADEAYAKLFAARMDMWFSWSLLIAFTVVVSVLLYINTQVGDHKLMLQGDRPANM